MSEKGAKPQIWISPRDTDGRPVDPELIAIGYKVFPGVVKFAQQIGLPDMTCIPEIVERVVHATSRNNGSGAFIEKSPQYIYAACKYDPNRVSASSDSPCDPTTINEDDFSRASLLIS
jgi:hypothetical protein